VADVKRPRLIRLGDWLSAGLNVLAFDGDNDESTSGRAYRESLQGRWLRRRRLIDALFSPWEREHCRKAYWADLDRARLRLLAQMQRA
jgi:hypothetical protein